MLDLCLQPRPKFAETAVKNLLFSATAADATGFDRYRDLYAVGTDLERPDGAFHAHVHIHLFKRMLIYERDIAGFHSKRGRARAGNDGFDHITAHLLLSGHYVGGPLGLEHRLRPGEIMLIDAMRGHWMTCTGGRLLTVQVARDVVQASYGNVDGVHGTILSEAAGGLLADFLTSLVRRMDNLTVATTDRAALTVAELLRLGLSMSAAGAVARGLSNDAAKPLRRMRAEAYIDEHLSNPSLDVETVAAGVGASRSALYQTFAEEGGIARYIQRRRLETLRKALRRPQEGRSVATLAFACGFVSESHCSQAFRAAFGKPPGRYRADLHHARQSRTGAGTTLEVFTGWMNQLY